MRFPSPQPSEAERVLDRATIRAHPLPSPLTALIGREQEVRQASTLLRSAGVRLLTMTGAGGIGKTRLALHVAVALLDAFENGVSFVPLASITHAAAVLPALEQALGLGDASGEEPLERLKAALGDRYQLLLLDNFEQVLPAAPQLIDLLQACPRLTLLVTSRAVLRVSGEHEFPVPPLALPQLSHLPEKDLLARYAAVALFVQRARAIKPAFQLTAANAAAIAEICVRLDGLPLAIELAAARIKLFSPQVLVRRLDKRLHFLTSGARDLPARQQTLRDTLGWSYDLLDAQGQHLFRWLAVFDGGCLLSAAEAVCRSVGNPTRDVVDGVTALIDQSLLHQAEAEEGEPRLVMLETIREYGLECLQESGEAEACEQAHARFYLQLVQEAEPHLKGGEQQLSWFARLEQDMANIFAALEAAFRYGLDAELVRGINAFAPFLFARGLHVQAEPHLKRAQQLASSLHDTLGLTDTLYHLSEAVEKQGSYAQAEAYLREGLTLARQLGDPTKLSQVLCSLGWVISRRGEYVQAESYLQEALALAKQVGDHELITHSCLTLSGVVSERGDYAQTENYLQEGLAVARQSGNRKHVCALLSTLGYLAFLRGEYSQAEDYTQETLELANQIGYREASMVSLLNLGQIAGEQGNYSEAERYSQEALVLARQSGNREKISSLLANLGTFAGAQGDESRARAYLQEALILARQIANHWLLATTLYEWGDFHLRQQRFDVANIAFREARDIASEGNAEYLALASYGLARIAAAHGDTLEAYRQGQESLAALESMGHSKASEVRSWLDTLPRPSPASSQMTPSAQPSLSYPAGLTTREVEVLRLVAQGLTNPQIATHLIISRHTANAHVRSLFNKVNVNSRTALTRFAIEHQLA